MKFFLKVLLPIILAVTVLIEGTSASAKLMVLPSDLAVLGGVVLCLLTIAAFLSFMLWFLKRLFKQ